MMLDLIMEDKRTENKEIKKIRERLKAYENELAVFITKLDVYENFLENKVHQEKEKII